MKIKLNNLERSESISKLFLNFCLSFLWFNSSLLGQDSISAVNFSSKMKLEKYFTIHHPSEFELSTMKLKAKNNKLYLFNNNFISGKGLILFSIDLISNQIDTHFIDLDNHAINVLDIDICNFNLYMLKDKSLTIYDFGKHTFYTLNINYPNNTNFGHFYVSDTSNIQFYEWQIGERKSENRSIYNYNLTNEKWDLIDQNTIDGLGFLGIYSSDKHIDLNSNLIVKFNPDKYVIPIYNIQTGKRDTIIRNLNSSNFISGDYIKELHNKYRIRPRLSILDSLDKHSFNNARLESIRVSGDSLVYVIYFNSYPPCENFVSSRKTIKYMDIWRNNKINHSWELIFKDLRLNNRANCGRLDISQVINLPYNFNGCESNWCVYNHYLIIPKAMPETIDIKYDVSSYYNRENFKGALNLYLLLFGL